MPVPNKEPDLKEEPSSTSQLEIEDAHQPDGGHNLTVNDIIIIDPDTLELDLNHGRIGKLQNLEPLTQIEKLYLRWNLITKIENLDTLTTLKELELYDNQITKIEGLEALVNLEILDLSFNRIKEIEGLEKLGNLEKLFLSSNKIGKIQNLGHLKKLTLLELGDNKIREIENLDNLTSLTSLFLGKNKITEIKNLDTLVNLTCLSLQSNRLTKLENLDKLVELNEIYLSENAICKIENLNELKKLETLDLAQNQISAIENTEALEELTEFWEPLIIASLDNIRVLAQYASFSLIMHTDHLKCTMTDQQFVLKWHYHENTLIQNLPYLLENDILSDVTISVGAQHVKAHKIVLAMCSAYFLQLFQEMKNTQHPVVVLHNASIDDVKAMLAFMYRGQCVVQKDQLPNLLSIAKLLKIQGLCDMKVPEKDVSAKTIPLVEPVDSLDESKRSSVSKESVRCDSELIEKDRPLEEGSYLPSSITLKRQNSGGYSTAINLSSDSKKLRLSSCSSTWEKPSRDTPENSPCSTEDNPLLYPISNTGKKQSSPKDTSETCKCFLCGKYLSNQYNLRVHMETHEETYHACQSCPHVSRSRDALRKHVSYRHPEEYLTRKRKKTEIS